MPRVLQAFSVEFEQLYELYSGVLLTSFHFHYMLLPPALPSSNQAFCSMLPENICGFHAALGAPGIQLSEVYIGTVWKQHRALETPLPPYP